MNTATAMFAPKIELRLIAAIKIRDDRLGTDRGLGIDTLVASIQRGGLMHPPTITSDGFLVDGYRRLQAMQRLGFDRVPCLVLDGRQVATERDGGGSTRLALEMVANVERSDYTPADAQAAYEVIHAWMAADPARSTTGDAARRLVTDAARAAGTNRTDVLRRRQIERAASDPTTPAPVREVAVEGLARANAGLTGWRQAAVALQTVKRSVNLNIEPAPIVTSQAPLLAATPGEQDFVPDAGPTATAIEDACGALLDAAALIAKLDPAQVAMRLAAYSDDARLALRALGHLLAQIG